MTFTDMFPPFERRPERYGRPDARGDVRRGAVADARAFEDAIWRRLAMRRLRGVPFERSRPVAGLVPGFAAPSRMLVVEVLPRGWKRGLASRELRWREAGYHVVWAALGEHPDQVVGRIAKACAAFEAARGSRRREDDG